MLVSLSPTVVFVVTLERLMTRSGILVVLVPLFQAEIAPPAVRGFLVSQHGVVLVGGYSLAAWIGFACYYSKNAAFQWRFPLCVQCLWPLVMLILIPFIPESPRWCECLHEASNEASFELFQLTAAVLTRDRREDAWDIVQKLHGTTDASEYDKMEFAKEEFYQMRQQVAADMAMAANENVWTLFKKP